jgi:predicted ArsR family transcriptional regulator
MKIETEKPLRYHEDGNVHLDFHGATNTTIEFIINNYGHDVMDQIFRKVGKEVYADIREHLSAGNSGELVKHWKHFFDREGADYTIDINEDEIVLNVNYCPAYHHVKKIAPKVSEHFCDQTIQVNYALAEGSPFVIETEITAPGACRQVIRKTHDPK